MSQLTEQITKPLITDDELRALYRAGRKIDALRELRARDDASLAEAMGYLDSIMTADDFAAWEAAQAARLAPTAPAAGAPLKLEWGMAVPAGVVLAWGARAIYSISTRKVPKRTKAGKLTRHTQTQTIASIDLLWDRQGTAGVGTEDERKALAAWINDKGLPALKKWCERNYVTTDCNEKFELFDGSDYALVASPRESYGYLYISAWVVPPGGLGNASEAE